MDFNQKLLAHALECYNRGLRLPCPKELAPSELWQQNIAEVIDAGVKANKTAIDLVDHVINAGIYTFYWSNQRPFFENMIDEYMMWLDNNGNKLSQFNMLVQEAHIVDKQFLTRREDRNVSVMFLYHLCICSRIISKIRNPIETVLEIGSGYGGVARVMKLLNPGVTYFMVDLPHSLFFAYLYISLNFPNAKTLFLTKKGEFQKANGKFDFVFVPAALVDELKGLHVDVALNTSSLGEMRQETVNRYLSCIQDSLEVNFFYSLNRYGQLPDQDVLTGGCARRSSTDAAVMSVPLDPHWNIFSWDLYGMNGFSRIHLINPPNMEFLAERIPLALRNQAYYEHLSRILLDEAQKLGRRDQHWENLLWNSIRYFPNRENLALYIPFIFERHYAEIAYYKQLWDNLL